MFLALMNGRQCSLLAELVDGELEEEGPPPTPVSAASSPGTSRSPSVSLTQDFPFEGCPPTIERVSAMQSGRGGGRERCDWLYWKSDVLCHALLGSTRTLLRCTCCWRPW